MPFGNFNTRHRLGIANCHPPDGSRWAKEILRLPSDTFNFTFPVYQGLLVHDRNWGGAALGPGGAAESIVGAVADADVESPNIIREASLHRTFFSFPNVSASSTPNSQYSLQTYATNRYSKVFFVNNEPDAYYHAKATTNNNSQDGVVNGIDNYNSIATSTFKTSFWDFLPIVNVTPPLPELPYSYYPRRATPGGMAIAFLKLKQDFEDHSNFFRNHTVLPPCPSGAIAGGAGAQDPYWPTFFDLIHPFPPTNPLTQITIGGQSATKITPSALKALHLHYYSPPRNYPNWPVNLPIETVAEGMFYLRKSVDWYRDRYVGLNQFLPLDVLLSEFGMLWNILQGNAPTHKWLWSGGWNNFRDGLSWWNSWLHWVMRRAPIDFKLTGATQGDYTDSRAVYANILEAHQSPYTTFVTYESVNSNDPVLGNNWQTDYGIRNQFFYNCDTGASGVTYTTESINVVSMLPSGRFLPSFSSFPVTTWNDGYNPTYNFRLGPFAACYKVWAEVGADAVTGNLATGWMDTTQHNQSGTITLNLQAGYSTVYIPIVKRQIGGTYAAGTRFDVKWGPQEKPFGYGEMSEFPDSQTVTTIYDSANTAVNPPQLNPRPLTTADYQSVYSSMVFPVVCWTAAPRNITIKIVRSNGGGASTGPLFSIGRPIVINRACSWLTNQ